MRLIRFAVAFLIAAFVFSAAGAQTYNLKEGDKLTALPCEAWKKNSDGSWTQIGTAVYPDGAKIGSNIFKNTQETKELEAKCPVK